MYLSTQEVADILGISRITVFRKIKSGEIKAEKFSRNFLIPTEQFVKHEILTEGKKEEIKRIIDKAIREYGETFRLLGEE